MVRITAWAMYGDTVGLVGKEKFLQKKIHSKVLLRPSTGL